jgi:hypothetical protein
MLTRSWIDALKSRFLRILNRHERRVSGRRGPEARRLKVEALEDRRVLAFDLAVGYPVGDNPQAIVSADFTNDGVLDLAVANYNSSTVSVLVGNAASLGVGDGTFQPAPTSATGSYPRSLAVGDFDGDGNMDLATANAYDVSVLLGNSDGTFGAPSSLGVVGYPTSVAVGDFNGDGLLDLGVTGTYSYSSYYGSYQYSYANVLIGNGDGTFSVPNYTFIDYAGASSALAIDLNGDIYDDFVTFDSYGYVAVLLGDSSGYLQAPSGYFYTGDYSYGLAAGDLDGDGDKDLVTANFYGNSVGVLLGDGAGGFNSPTNYAAGGYPATIVLGDFTHDGNLDVATSNYYSAQVSVLYGDGAGAFSTPAISATGSYPWAIAAGDFDGDTWLDAATANTGDNTISVLINDTSWPDPPPPPPPTVSIGDATVTEGNTGATSATFTVYLSKAYSQDVTVHYATADGTATAGSDYTGASGDVTISGGLGLTSQTFTIDITGDRVWEPTETFTVNLSSPVNATIVDGQEQGIGTIYDDEPVISIDDVTVTEGAGTSSVNATFTVWLSDTSDVDVTVHYVLADGTATGGNDFTGGSGDVTIPANQYSQTFTVAVLGDRVGESTETFLVNLSAPVSAGIADSQGVGTIIDNEPRISISDVTKKEGNGGKIQFIFTVTLLVAYDETVTVNYATANGTATAGSDYTAKNGTLTFAPGVTSQIIIINVTPDKTKEADEKFYVNLSGPSSNVFLFDAQGVGTIQDDDNHGK